MALINHAKGEINAKIVFFGPAFAGKGTNLNHIYRKIRPENRGQMKSMNVGSNRMLFFDFSPAGQAKIGEYGVRFHVYSIVGEVSGDTAWKMVLKGVDGIVFVADSNRERMAANTACLDDLHRIMRGYGMGVSELPGVLQCNKRDIGSPMPLAEMESALNYGGFAVIPAAAGKGEGVLESISALVKGVLKNIREKGVVPGTEGEEPAASERPEAPAKEETPPAAEPIPADAMEEPRPFVPPTVRVDEETVVVSPMPEPAPEVETAGAPEPVVHLAGEPEALSGGRIRLPLKVICCGVEKALSVTLTITVGLD